MGTMLHNKVAIVTGASSGNGRAIALAFARHGAKVIVADLTRTPREGGEPTAALINSTHPGQARFQPCDVTSIADLAATVDIAEAWGGLDILVNNAGILKKQPLLDATEAVFQQMIDVNVKSVFFASQAAARVMLPRKRGVIINLGSQNGIREGMRLSLIQDGVSSSELRVDMVDETICAAAVSVLAVTSHRGSTMCRASHWGGGHR